jgi:RNA polymerase sporulation-specific sigma factor
MKHQENYDDEFLRMMAVSGDTEAEDTLILKYSRVVRACARPISSHGGDSEDLYRRECWDPYFLR